MAPATVEAELAIVDIVGTMAIIAAAAQVHLGGERLPVAGLTVGIAMRAVEREAGLPVMIETPLRPVDRRVAKSAIVGKTVTVRIFGRMA